MSCPLTHRGAVRPSVDSAPRGGHERTTTTVDCEAPHQLGPAGHAPCNPVPGWTPWRARAPRNCGPREAWTGPVDQMSPDRCRGLLRLIDLTAGTLGLAATILLLALG
jgi:hypothetical protein